MAGTGADFTLVTAMSKLPENWSRGNHHQTHIRNLYQKLGVAHRQDAVQHAQQLLKMMGYGV
ncbi:hypothetical protein ACNKHR_14975 [Shigella flexneri]